MIVRFAETAVDGLQWTQPAWSSTSRRQPVTWRLLGCSDMDLLRQPAWLTPGAVVVGDRSAQRGRLPERVLQENADLPMVYDHARLRVEWSSPPYTG